MSNRTKSCHTCRWGVWEETEPLCPGCVRFSKWETKPARPVYPGHRDNDGPDVEFVFDIGEGGRNG